MKFFQISLAGHQPQGALFDTRAAAEREVYFLKQDDLRHAREAWDVRGIVVECPDYTVHEVERG